MKRWLLISLISAAAHAELPVFQIWSDESGLLPAAFCQVSPDAAILNPKMNAFVDGATGSDGSRWQMVMEEGHPVTIDCLENGTSKNYVLFATEEDGQTVTVGFNAGELSFFTHTASARALAAPLDLPAGVALSEGSLDYTVCISSSTLNVRDESLDKVIFTVKRFDPAKPVQSFGTDKKKKVISGVEYAFIKVEFPSSAKTGWVADKYIVVKNQCAGAVPAPKPETPVAAGWSFPTIKRPTDSYKAGMRRFKASRSGGRLHAACDLYRVTNEAAVAVASGKVIRDRYYFYEGTYAIEIKHTGGRVARYGEVTGKAAPNVGLNKSVSLGQTIGYIGKVNSGCCQPMLHFELYSGTATGALSQSGNSFRRRKDLIDPTALLSTWEKQKFGTSY